MLLGVILGFAKKIVVYRDFADLTKVFMLVLALAGLYILLGDKIQNNIVRNILIVIGGGLLVWILITTFLHNRNIFKTVLVFIAKIPLGVTFAFYLINLISPGG